MAYVTHEEDWDRVPDEELVETSWERIEGLKEMFPQPVRNGVANLVDWTTWIASNSFWLTRNALWITVTSSMLVFLPYTIEKMNADTQKKETDHQRQVLLGPSSAIASAKSTQ